MKLERLMISAAMLFCLAVLLSSVISPALAGQGCGTNWMGDTSRDTDFYVSKNQNLGTSGTGASGEGAPVKVGQASLILNLTPDKPGPQLAGNAITWTAKVSDKIKNGALYNFYLKGPSTGGQLAEKTGWTTRSTWTWNSTGADAGENQVEVRVKAKASTKDFDDQKAESYVIEETTKKGTTAAEAAATAPASSDIDSHPVSATDESTIKNPKLAPDEMPKTAQASTRPNMDMPSPTPKPVASESTAQTSSMVDSHPPSRTADSKMNKPRLAPDERHRAEASGSTSGPNMNMPDTKPMPLASASNAGADKQAETTSAADEQETQTSPEPDTPDVMDVGGKWTIGLKDIGCSMDLILIQSGETVMCSGTLNEQGNKIPLMASGSVAGNSLKLDVKTVVGKYVNQIDKHFNLDLVKVDRQISGSYEAYSGDSLEGKGKVTASRFGT